MGKRSARQGPYEQLALFGDQCKVPTCERPRRAGGYCAKHYRRWKAHGDPLFVGRRKAGVNRMPIEGAKSCSRCTRPAEQRGWCGMHYRRWRLYGDLNRGRIKKVWTEKTCGTCKVTKPMTEFQFGVGRNLKSYASICKPCAHASGEARRLKRRDADLAAKKAYRDNNIEHWRAYGRLRYRLDPEKARALKRADYQRHIQKRRAQVRAWRLEHPVEYRALQRNNYARRRAAKRASQTAFLTQADIKAKVAYWGDQCWVCGGSWTDIDHVKPITKGGAHLLCNLRPICGRCNKRKSARWPWSRVELLVKEVRDGTIRRGLPHLP